MHIASGKGNISIVKELLRHGADINAQKNNGQTAIHILLHTQPHIECFPEQEMLKLMDVLLDKQYKINLELKCNEGLTPLENAIKLGLLKMARKIAKVLCSKQ